LTAASSKLAEDHCGVLKVVAEVFDKDVLEASQVETVFES
jgi:hypothetical protein